MTTDVSVFTTGQVVRLTGITKRKLAYWIERGVIAADIDAASGRGHVRLFSFQNLVEVRVGMWLRDLISLQLIGKIVAHLREKGAERPLAEETFGVFERTAGRRVARDVVMMSPNDAAWEDWQSGQKILEVVVPVHVFSGELRDAAERDRKRQRRVGQIERRRGVLGSTPVLAGTRVPTRAIWALHQAGYDTGRILKNYPGLGRRDVEAAIQEETKRRQQSA